MAKKKDYHECLTTPFETGIKNFTQIARYFMYYSPEIDSAQSVGKIKESSSDALLHKMLKETGLTKSGIIQQRIKKESWNKVTLADDMLDFEQPRFLCDRYKTETELHALLRHIRNALAHGYLYVWKKKSKGAYVFLVDFDKDKNKVTAKIMVSLTIMESWKAMLENQIAIGE